MGWFMGISCSIGWWFGLLYAKIEWELTSDNLYNRNTRIIK